MKTATDKHVPFDSVKVNKYYNRIIQWMFKLSLKEKNCRMNIQCHEISDFLIKARSKIPQKVFAKLKTVEMGNVQDSFNL